MPDTTLLGFLARFSSFSTQSEVLCTQGLAYLLRSHEDARSALAHKIQAVTGVAVGGSLAWLAEATQRDGGIPDLEARTPDADGNPVIKIEAKLGAVLQQAQLHSYAADLRKRNSGESVLLVLVPTGRKRTVRQVTREAFDQSGSDPWQLRHDASSGRIVVSIISWDELFSALKRGECERFRYELEALQAMYNALSNDYVAPLASDEDLRKWRTRETDFVQLVDQVTRRMSARSRVLPMQTEILEQLSPDQEPLEYRRRYVCPFPDDASCYSIGVRDPFENSRTPIWLRFHKDTGDFKVIRQRLESSDLDLVESNGHSWLPLNVDLDISGQEMIERLVARTEEILRIAFDL